MLRLYIFFTALVLLCCLNFQQMHALNFTVTSTADVGTHTLRWAILRANVNPGPDIITFNIPGAGPHTINLFSPLPALTDPSGVVIDALTQPGTDLGNAAPSTMSLRIVIDGRHAGETPGLSVHSSNNIIQGLAFINFSQEGIRLHSLTDQVSENTIRYCIVGSDSRGLIERGNAISAPEDRSAGISLIATGDAAHTVSKNTIASCLISGNSGNGILLYAESPGTVSLNTIRDNYIGTTLTGDKPLPNAFSGLLMYGNCHENEITENTIGGNEWHGVHIVGDARTRTHALRNTISRNFIGTNADNDKLPNKHDGISFGGANRLVEGGFSRNNIASNNIVAWNGRNGITVWEHPSTLTNSDANRLSRNSMYGNGRMDIDLGDDGFTANDTGDMDNGANQQINHPILSSAFATTGHAVINGTVDVRQVSGKYTVELFKCCTNTSPVKGRSLFLGSVTPDISGSWVFSTAGKLMPGDNVRATLIDSDGNTSEFSNTIAVSDGLFVDDAYGPFAPRPSADKLSIHRIAPTPVLDNTEITVALKEQSWVTLEVFSSAGELVSTVVNQLLDQGEHTVTWNTKNWYGQRVQPGWYLCVLEGMGSRDQKQFEIGSDAIGEIQP